jgi:hypothetical protein
LCDWLSTAEVESLSNLLPHFGKFMEDENILAKLRTFIKEESTGKEREKTEEVITKMTDFYKDCV